MKLQKLDGLLLNLSDLFDIQFFLDEHLSGFLLHNSSLDKHMKKKLQNSEITKKGNTVK